MNCSTYLTQPPKRYSLFTYGKRSGSGAFVWDQTPSATTRVSLDRNFADVEMVSDMIEPAALGFKHHGEDVIAKMAEAEWKARKDDLLFSINYGIMRGPMVNPPPEAVEFLKPYGNMGYLLLEPLKTIIAPLYNSYAHQGPERALLLPEILEQDSTEISRYTRFVISRYIKPMAYAQVLISKDPSEPLHVSQTWGSAVADLVRTKPDEVVGELGRLHLIHPNEYQYDRHARVVDRLENEQGKLKTNRTVTFMLLQKILAWTNSDARLDRLLIQVNLQVERVMLMNGVPLKLGQRRELKKSWGGQNVTEVVYAFDREALLKVEEILMAQTLSAWLRSATEQPFFKQQPNGHLVLSFYANEIRALKRIGFYEALFPEKEPMPLDIDGDGVKMVIDLDLVPAALKILEPYK